MQSEYLMRKEVDEIMLLDIDASKKNREPNYDLFKKFASECFMPLTYGGGIDNMHQAEKFLLSLRMKKFQFKLRFALRNMELMQNLVKNFWVIKYYFLNGCEEKLPGTTENLFTR